MAKKDEETPTAGEPGEMSQEEFEQMLAEQEATQEREKIERQARGFPGPMVASRSADGPPSPVAERLEMMEAAGVPAYVIKAEKRSMEANRKAWAEHLGVIKRKGVPEAPAQTIAAPMDAEMLTAAQQEYDRVLMARMELASENPPRRNGRTLEEMILTQPDETIPGGAYLIGGKLVDAYGRVIG